MDGSPLSSSSSLSLKEKFIYSRGNTNSPKYLIIGEAWGSEEARAKKPFIGPAGRMLSRLLKSAGIDERDCCFTNLMDMQPAFNDFRKFLYRTKEAPNSSYFQGLYVRPELRESINLLWEFISKVNPKFIIPLGNYPTWFFVGARVGIVNANGYKIPSGISKWRGSQLYVTNPIDQHQYKVMPTYHPAAILRNWEFYIDALHDLKIRINKSWEEPERNFVINPSLSDTINLLKQMKKTLPLTPLKDCIAVDLEIQKDKRIACIGIGMNETDVICIPVNKYSHIERMQLASALRDFFKDVKVIGQNFLFDAQYLFHYYLLYLPPYYDTMLMRHVLAPGTPLDLNYLSSHYCEFHRYWKDEGKEIHSEEGEIQGWIYNCKDVAATYEIAVKLKEELELENLADLYDFQRRQADMILRMMLRGVRIDLEEREKRRKELDESIKDLEKVLKSYLPEYMTSTPRWFTSPKQLKELFYDRLRIKPVRSQTGSATVNEEALEKIAKREPLVSDLISLIKRHRKLYKFRTFLKMELDEDNRMRCEFTPTAETFRWKSRKNVFGSGGNLQNLPKGGVVEDEKLPNIHSIFIPDDGFMICDMDLAGADAQVVAWDAGDEDLKEAFRKGLKIHLKNARDIFPEETKDMTDEEIKKQNYPGGIYHDVKRFVHATNYGVSARTIAQKLKWTIAKAEEMQRRWFAAHPAVAAWHRRVESILAGRTCPQCHAPTTPGRCTVCGARTGGIIANRFGYRRVYYGRPETLLKEALAWIPQSTVANVTGRAQKKLEERFKHLPLIHLMQVHDSMVFQIPVNTPEEVIEEIKKEALVTIPYEDPLVIPWGFSCSTKSWGDCD